MNTPALVRCTVLLIVTMLNVGVGAQAVHAQQSSLAPGTKIRVELRNGDRREGRVISSGRDTLVAEWAGGSTPAFPVSEIVKLEAVTGKHRAIRRGAVIGAVVGASLGLVIGALSYEPCEDTVIGGCLFAPRSRAASAELGGVLLGVGGLVAGGVVGMIPREQWERVRPDGNAVRFNLRALPGGGRAVGLALAF